MKYWDTSAIVPLFVEEETSSKVQRLLGEDRDAVTWWGTAVECISAIERLKRAGVLKPDDFFQAKSGLEEILAEIDFVDPTLPLRDRALRLLASHPLRAGDALQLASALIWSQDQTRGAGFVCLDRRLREAALAEGFAVVP